MDVSDSDATARLVVPHDRAECQLVHQVEGVPLDQPAEARVLAHGDQMLLVEVVMPGEESSPAHVHDHESVGYVVRGRVRTTIGGVVHELGPGDGFRHPEGVEHDMTAVGGEAVWLEVKSPPVVTWRPT